MDTNNEQSSMPKRVLQSLGLVFGDIGTSPIYTLTVIFLITTPTEVQTIGYRLLASDVGQG